MKLFGQKHDLFVVSPFLSDGTIKELAKTADRKILVTRKSSVTRTVLDTFTHVYITKDILTDNEFAAKQDIHAKLYFTPTYDGNFLYIGSANASHNAFHRNVECLLQLKYKPYGIGMWNFMQDFIPNENCPYEEITCVPEVEVADDSQRKIEEALREAVYALKRAEVTADGDAFDLAVSARELKTTERIYIAPLQRLDLMCALQPQTQFKGILLKEISEFFVLKVQDQTLVVKVDTRGIPKGREEAIYRSIIDTKAKFMSYLSFVLSENPSAFAAETDMLDSILLSDEKPGQSTALAVSVYEKMLRVFHQNPNRIKSIADMIRRLDPEIIGEEFMQMYAAFELAAKKVQR